MTDSTFPKDPEFEARLDAEAAAVREAIDASNEARYLIVVGPRGEFTARALVGALRDALRTLAREPAIPGTDPERAEAWLAELALELDARIVVRRDAALVHRGCGGVWTAAEWRAAAREIRLTTAGGVEHRTDLVQCPQCRSHVTFGSTRIEPRGPQHG